MSFFVLPNMADIAHTPFLCLDVKIFPACIHCLPVLPTINMIFFFLTPPSSLSPFSFFSRLPPPMLLHALYLCGAARVAAMVESSRLCCRGNVDSGILPGLPVVLDHELNWECWTGVSAYFIQSRGANTVWPRKTQSAAFSWRTEQFSHH